jgi:putative endonuclease
MTTDLRHRFREHQAGESFATKGRRLFSLIYYEACLSFADASNREKYFKTTGGRRSLAKRLRDYMRGRNPKLS